MSDDTAETQADALASDDETAKLALAAAEAIRRLISERNTLRSRLTSHEHELRRLREHIVLIRNSYRRLANELVTQLELVDKFDIGAGQEAELLKFPRFLGNVPPEGS
jgi:predicted nuclease with TOPRIM domain